MCFDSDSEPPIPRIAIITVIAFVALNIAFYLLPGSYFESHHEVLEQIGAGDGAAVS